MADVGKTMAQAMHLALSFNNYEKLLKPPRNYNLADWLYEQLLESISVFEESIPDDMQTGGRFVSFQDIVFSIDDISYVNPNIIVFYGTLPDGSSVKLLQHTSQLNILLYLNKLLPNGNQINLRLIQKLLQK